MAIFTREALDERAFAWLGMFANQAAVAIENARAFENSTGCGSQLERDNAYLHEQVKEGLAFGEIVGPARRCRTCSSRSRWWRARHRSLDHRGVGNREGAGRASDHDVARGVTGRLNHGQLRHRAP